MTVRSAVLVAAVASFVAACSGKQPPQPASAAAPDAAPPAAPVASTSNAPVRGVATYLERIKMPPGASLQVDLLGAESGASVGSKTLRDVAGAPYPFELPVPSTPHPAGYAVRATLIGPDGQRWFETPAPVGVMPGGNSVEVRMRRAAASDAVAAPPTGPVAHWECGDLGVMSRFDDAPKQVRLAYNGASVTLPLARSASGARYADARGNEFWTKGATGTLTLAGEPARDCVQASQVSPWNQAVLRGATFRAVGNEPGWTAEIAGTPPRLDALLDYGQTHVTAPLKPAADGYTGIDSTGRAIRMTVKNERCRDGMSGQAFEATVTLDVGGTTYRGCGAKLQD
ncbi:MliC family protein [Cognatilysobacter terrigena]|uniref:MliC family protein n=1 Tax=Cognatilysobacter terrigena TaxID=2488749 RepID=UPI00105FA880|nr:MliC family protein [Lysobacter terrigena]